MNRCLSIAICVWLCDGAAFAQTCATYPNHLTNGTTADANQVMGNFTCAALTGAGSFTGSVGVNAPSPAATLDLGTSITTIKLAVFEQSGANAYGMGVNSGELTFGAALSSMSATPQMVLTNAGNLGVGTTAPYALLDLGTAVTTIKLAAYEQNGANAFGMGVNSGELTFGAGLASLTATPQMVLTTAGYVGIGTTSPGYPLQVPGTIYAGTYAGGSDLRHKQNVKTLAPGTLDVVAQLRPVTFAWKHPVDDGARGEQIGLIAQEVQKVLPAVVLKENNAEGSLSIKYTELIPLLIKAVQEQQAEIAALRSEVAAMKGAR